MSRWTTPASWACWSASVICGTKSRASRWVIEPSDQELPQARPLHVFHHQAVEVLRLADVEHRHDERVPQLRERARLAEEPLLERVIGLEVGPDDLDGDEPVQERLAALVDHPHAAVAQQFHHFQVGEARGQLRGRGRRVPRRRSSRRPAGCGWTCRRTPSPRRPPRRASSTRRRPRSRPRAPRRALHRSRR